MLVNYTDKNSCTIPISAADAALMEGPQQGREPCCPLAEGPLGSKPDLHECGPDSFAEPQN